MHKSADASEQCDKNTISEMIAVKFSEEKLVKYLLKNVLKVIPINNRKPGKMLSVYYNLFKKRSSKYNIHIKKL